MYGLLFYIRVVYFSNLLQRYCFFPNCANNLSVPSMVELQAFNLSVPAMVVLQSRARSSAGVAR